MRAVVTGSVRKVLIAFFLEVLRNGILVSGEGGEVPDVRDFFVCFLRCNRGYPVGML